MDILTFSNIVPSLGSQCSLVVDVLGFDIVKRTPVTLL